MSEGRISSSVPNELRWLSRRIRPLILLHISSFLCITAGSALGLITPLVLKWMIDRIIPLRHATLLLLAMFLIFLGSQGKTAVTSVGSYLMMTAAQRMSLNLRMELLRHLNSLSADYYDKTPIGTIVYPLREPIEEIAYFASDLVPAILRMLLTTSFTLSTMLVLSPALTLLVVPFVPVFLLARQHFRKKLTVDSDRAQHDRILWSNFLEEHLTAAIPIQLLRRQKQQERRAFRLLAWSFRSQEKLFRTGTWFTLATSMAIVLAMSAVIGYGGWRVIVGSLSLGSLVAFYSFVTQLFDPLSGAAEIYSRAQKTFASVRQVHAVLGLRPTVVDAPAACAVAPNRAKAIELSRVEFGYDRQKRMLRIPSLLISAGEKVAIAGENGAGKSTLAKLIARVYDVDCGSVRIGNDDIRNIQLDSLRRCVCYLPREPALFDGTLLSNIRFVSPSAPHQEVQDVIAQAGLCELVRKLPDGIHQTLGPGACQLSGGERQRVAIARALLQRPLVMILDEATSCLDPCSEDLVLRNAFSYLRESTVIVVSHRNSTLSSFARKIFMSDGAIVGDQVSEMPASLPSSPANYDHGSAIGG